MGVQGNRDAEYGLSPQQILRVCGLDELVKMDQEAGAANHGNGVDL